jgi:hypothetical protein
LATGVSEPVNLHSKTKLNENRGLYKAPIFNSKTIFGLKQKYEFYTNSIQKEKAMLLSMMLILAITSTILELMIAAKVPAWRRLSAKSPLFNLINSLFLSFLVGIAFGAAGLIAMGAGVISTVLSVPGYKFLYWNYDSPEAQKHGGNMMQHVKSKWSQAFKDLVKVIYSIIRVITFPIWGTRLAIQKYNSFKLKFTR